MKEETRLELLRIALDLTRVALAPEHKTAVGYAAKRALGSEGPEELRVFRHVHAHLLGLFEPAVHGGQAVAGAGHGVEGE